MDYLYDSWTEKKRIERERMAASGKHVVSSFSVNENDDFDEMFGEGDKEDDTGGITFSDAKELVGRHGIDIGSDL